MQGNYRQAGRKRRLRRRSSPAKQILKIVIAAVICLAAVYLTLTLALGFTVTTRKIPLNDGTTLSVSYVGFLKDGVASTGSVTTSRGESGKISGDTILYSDGSRYTGDLDGFVRHGKGKMTYANGDVYEGEFSNDEILGIGKFTYYKTGDVYEGNIKNGKKTGQGKYSYLDGTCYEGNYDRDMPNGQGKLTFFDGAVYEGNFVDGTRQGQGKYTFASGDVYEGEFKDGKMQGNGVYSFACGDKYEGQFSDGKINGEGKYTWADGRDYTGTFKDGIAVVE